VAMTRAADRLIVGGCMPGNMNSVRKNSWYDLLVKGLRNSGLDEQTIEAAEGPIKRYSHDEHVVAPGIAAAAPPALAAIELPSWLKTSAPAEAAGENVLRPSDPAGHENRRAPGGQPIQMRARALQRGTLVHRLLQSLPDVPAARRREAALNYLARHAQDWTDAERESLILGLLGLIGDGRFAPVFAAGSRAEASIAGRLQRPGRPPALISGQIDRLVVTPHEVLIVDYKTNSVPPCLPAEAPLGYIRQLALYRAVLEKLYPRLPVRAALLWTERPELMEIPGPLLDARLTSIIST